jgi:exosortase E/protease (VPEID-CTERM system)
MRWQASNGRATALFEPHQLQTMHGAVTALEPEVRHRFSTGLARRLAVIAGILLAEIVCLSIWLDAADLFNKSAATTAAGHVAPWVVRFLLVFATCVAALAIGRQRSELAAIARQSGGQSWKWPAGMGHAAAMALFVIFSHLLFATPVRGTEADVLLGAWVSAGISTVILLALFANPISLWVAIALRLRRALIYASAAGFAVCFGMTLNSRLWQSTAALTFRLVRLILSCFLRDIVADPVSHTIGTSRFQVEIAPQCSGLEGIGLVLVFVALWLVFFRRDFRFPASLVLLPIGAIAVFGMNAVRIAGLILIGNAGAPGIALGGFHSQAGWISFIAVALAVCGGSQHWAAIRTDQIRDTAPRDATTAYLTPFLAILAASIVARAASADFEWLYPLRVIAGALVLWGFRRSYRGLNWKLSYAGPVIGIGVFLLWILPWPSSASHMPETLKEATPLVRNVWIVFRCAGAILTVPIAEELAFRGFLLRRLVSPDFELLDYRHFTWIALTVSSLVFGAMHGGRWIAGTLAGLLYAFAMLRKGRIGDAVAAHATTNALLAILVLTRGEWGYW